MGSCQSDNSNSRSRSASGGSSCQGPHIETYQRKDGSSGSSCQGPHIKVDFKASEVCKENKSVDVKEK
jgi:hypothetical protein